MFGREPELARIERLLEQASAGPAGLALEGVPGIGKSTVWREGVRSAQDRGLQVLATAPSEPDAALAFAGLGDLFDQLPSGAVAGLPEPQRRALDAALSVADSDAEPVNPQALPRAALGVLRTLAEAAPVLVAIDDEQWLDRPSARVLAFALCRLTEERVAVLLARRPESGGALWPELTRGFAGDGLQAVTMDPLGLGATRRLLASVLSSPIGRPLLQRVHEASGGNPLYALAIVRELEKQGSGGHGGSEVPIPATLTDALARRLSRLEPRAEDPLLVTAAVSQPTLALLQSVLPRFALSDLDGAERAGIVEVSAGRVRFTHPLLASTHYANAPAARRRELHRLLAEVLDDEEQRAHHLAQGAEAPDREIAATIELAAGAAARRGAPDGAAELLEQASRLTPADAVEARTSRIISAAEMHWKGGDAIRARELLERLLPDLPSGPTRARALMQLAEIRTDDGEVAHALAEEALGNAGDHHGTRSTIESMLAMHCSNMADFAAMLVHARAAVEAAELTGDPGLLSRATGVQAEAAFFNGEEVDFAALHRAVELEDSAPASAIYLPSASLAEILFWSDDYDTARPALDRVLRQARDRGEVYDTGAALFELAVLEWYAGNREAAEEHRRGAEDLVRGQGPVKRSRSSTIYSGARRDPATRTRSRSPTGAGGCSSPRTAISRVRFRRWRKR